MEPPSLSSITFGKVVSWRNLVVKSGLSDHTAYQVISRFVTILCCRNATALLLYVKHISAGLKETGSPHSVVVVRKAFTLSVVDVTLAYVIYYEPSYI